MFQNDSGRGLKWGDEVEYIIVKLDHEAKKARVSLRADTLLSQLTEAEENMKKIVETGGEADHIKLPSLWRPEYASYMVEGTPGDIIVMLMLSMLRHVKLHGT